MAGNVAGGKKAAAKNLANNPNFYKDIGGLGGSKGTTGGFGSPKVGKDGLTGAERARLAGAQGGRVSRRKKTVAVEA